MKLGLWICVALFGLFAGTAHATPITFTLSSSLLPATAGTSVTFTGTLTDIGGTVTFLNGDNVNGPLPADDTPFLTNFPLFLTPFGSFTAPMFVVTVPLLTAPGIYTGTFTVLGGASPTALTTLAAQTYGVSVTATATAVPEPASIWLLATGGAALLARHRGRRRI